MVNLGGKTFLPLIVLAPVLGLAGLAVGCAGHTTASSALRAPNPPDPNIRREVKNALDAGDGDYDARVLRARLDADPSDLNTRLELARHYQRAGFPEVAIEHCRLACERAPESVDAHIALAKILREEQRPSEGADVLAKFATDRPKEAGSAVDVWAWLGILRDEAGDWKSGESAYRAAIALAPGRDDLRNNLGYCLLRQGRSSEAAEEFRAALKIRPDSAIARNNLGAALAASLSKDAILNWQSVGSPADAHNNMAAVLIEEGRYPEARREIELALGYDRGHQAALNNLRLVSELDGKAPDVKLPQGNKGVYARLRAAWHRFWNSGETNGHDTMASGTDVASR